MLGVKEQLREGPANARQGMIRPVPPLPFSRTQLKFVQGLLSPTLVFAPMPLKSAGQGQGAVVIVIFAGLTGAMF